MFKILIKAKKQRKTSEREVTRESIG